MDFGCPTPYGWIVMTILLFLTTVTFAILFLLEKFNWGNIFRKSNFQEKCEAGDCLDGLSCIDGQCGFLQE